MQLTKTTPVPSGMSFDLDTGPAPRLAYLLSTPGNACQVGLVGNGTWAVEVLASYDGLNFDVIATLTTPGQRRYETKGVVAVAIRVGTYTSGALSGMLAHGGLVPTTNVSAMFGSFLIFSYNTTAVEPPVGNQIRRNNAVVTAITKIWIAFTTIDGVDQFLALTHIPHGGTLLVQDKDNHLNAVLFTITGPPLNKGTYVEVPVVFQQGTGAFAAQQVLVAVFNPGAVLSLTPATATEKITAGRDA